ncbi:MAG: oxygen-independent coproporphyrinogen III oxidase [Myxococcales bacterium]|nr:oxygen-independent coproporphyrinogen III oxidase [Myxococcales bacterium]
MNSVVDPGIGALLERFDRPGPRYTSYPTAVEFSDRFTVDDALRCYADVGRRGAELALYVHLPFCRERCTYCACNVVSTPRHDRVSAPYVQHLLAEVDRVAEAVGARAPVSQLHLGGGTPTYHTPEELTAVVEHLRERFDFAPEAECSVEVDPRVTSRAHLEALAAAGFRRLSVGVQDLEPAVQVAIGRDQPAAMTAATVADARALGFVSVNVDLVYGLPLQTVESLRDTIRAVLDMRPDRLAVYSFAWLPNAFAHQRAIDEATLPRGAEKVALLGAARDLLLEAGYVDIGIDHFALPSDPLAIAQAAGTLRRDFMGYTTRQSTEYIGFGVSAIGYVAGAFIQNEKRLIDYLRAVDGDTLPVARGVQLDDDDLRRAYVIGELMCNFHVDKARYRAHFGRAFDADFAEDLPRLAPLIAEDFVVDDSEGIRVTTTGRFVARNAAMCFDRYRRGAGGNSFSRTL